MTNYCVQLRLAGMVSGEWTSDNLSEALGDYVIISQTWFEPILWQYPDVTLTTK